MNADAPALTVPGTMSNQQRLRDAIKQLILNHHLRPGDSLPTESELMELLGASRNALREAIKALQALGFVDIRHGSGTFVGTLPLTPLQDFLSFRMQQSVAEDFHEVGNLLQLREALEVGLATDVVRAHTNHGTARLTLIVAEMKRRADAGEYFPDEDLAFHGALYVPIRNALVTELLEVFWTTFHLVDPLLPGPQFTPHECWGWHQHLLEAIERSDVDLYRVRMRDHFDGIRVRISRAEPEMQRSEEIA
ncbi:FadR/GntR family transcriptional regulator [Brachybacterium alimentarium]|uniref:FadR/GntR family transcriptional regulator n=1 Tax=Brachybacterium alimentarium TaxID=47845 RepID=UPI003FD099BC